MLWNEGSADKGYFGRGISIITDKMLIESFGFMHLLGIFKSLVCRKASFSAGPLLHWIICQSYQQALEFA